MPVHKRSVDFFETEDGLSIKLKLQRMFEDSAYNTQSTYSSNSTLYPDNLMPFLEKHMSYLMAHPSVDPSIYVANLRLMTRRR